MTVWQEALDSLSVREQSGKTAQVLIGAAEKMKEQNTEALRLMSLDYEEKIAKMSDRIKVAEANVKEQKVALESQEKKIANLKEPRRTSSVEGDVIKYVYSPAKDGTLWRLDEIESALMHLRLSGGDEDTVIRVESGILRTSITDDGQPITAWSRPKAPPEVTEEELKRYKWARLRTWSIAGFIGFVIGGWIGMGIV